jgi:asparagine N-glycosylation enzyme membrane subunit Stt3
MLLLFSSKYMDSIKYAKMLLLMILASIPGAFLGTFAIAKRKIKTIILRVHIFSFFRLLIMSGFVYQWGIMGAVWALNLNTILGSLLAWVGMRWEEVSQE